MTIFSIGNHIWKGDKMDKLKGEIRDIFNSLEFTGCIFTQPDKENVQEVVSLDKLAELISTHITKEYIHRSKLLSKEEIANVIMSNWSAMNDTSFCSALAQSLIEARDRKGKE